MAGTYTKIQVVAANNGAAASTAISATLAPTQNGSTLFAIIMAGGNNNTLTMPTGWSALRTPINTQPTGGTMFVFYYEDNPGNLTTINGVLGVAALASIIIYEVQGPIILSHVAYYDSPASGAFANSNGTGWGLGTRILQSSNELGICAVGYINNTALTATYPSGFIEDAATIGTAAAGNAGLRAASNMSIGTATTAVSGLTISGTPTNGPDTLFIAYLYSPILANNGNVGPANIEGGFFE